MELFEGAIRHLPEKQIPRANLKCLGFSDNYDVILTVEEGEFRIYNYEYWSLDSIHDGDHEEDSWVGDIFDYFEFGGDCLDKDTCQYVVAKFESKNPIYMARELLDACREELEDTDYRLEDNGAPSLELIDFIKSGLIKIAEYKGSLVYGYYK